MYINAIMTGFSASYLLRYDLSFFIVMVRFGLYTSHTTVPEVCYCVQFHVMAVLFTFFNIELYKYLDICFTYIISRNCFSLREPTESPTLVQARSSARKINKKSLNFLTDQTSWRLQDSANWRPQFLFCCLVLWLVYYLLIGWCYLSGAGLGGVSPCLLDRFVSSRG